MLHSSRHGSALTGQCFSSHSTSFFVWYQRSVSHLEPSYRKVWGIFVTRASLQVNLIQTHHSLNAIVAQSKNCSFVVNTMNELKNITNKSNNTGIQQGIFQITSVPVLLNVVVIFLRSIIVLTPNCIFWIVPVLQSVNDTEKHTKDSLKFTFFCMSVYYFR